MGLPYCALGAFVELRRTTKVTEEVSAFKTACNATDREKKVLRGIYSIGNNIFQEQPYISVLVIYSLPAPIEVILVYTVYSRGKRNVIGYGACLPNAIADYMSLLILAYVADS